MTDEKERKEPENSKEKYNSKVTKEDINALGSKGLSMDTGDDRLLENAIEIAARQKERPTLPVRI